MFGFNDATLAALYAAFQRLDNEAAGIEPEPEALDWFPVFRAFAAIWA